MAKHESVDGVVVRVRDVGDHDRYLSVLTAENGRITMLSKGSHSVRSPQVAVSQLYTYGNFEYYRKGSMNILKGGSAIHPFYALSSDIDRLNLATYLCEVTCELTDEGEPAEEMLRLLLNSFHAICTEKYPQEQIKGTFELRAAAISGYAPDLSGCCRCGCADAELFYLDVMNGALICETCRKKGNATPVSLTYADELREAEILGILPGAVCAAFRYCTQASLSRLLSFELTDAQDMESFSKLAQTYLLSHIGHGFESLNFYQSMRRATVDSGVYSKHQKKEQV